jgi:hypothetical protein
MAATGRLTGFADAGGDGRTGDSSLPLSAYLKPVVEEGPWTFLVFVAGLDDEGIRAGGVGASACEFSGCLSIGFRFRI